MLALSLVKQPHTLHRKPVWCSQEAQVSSRRCPTPGETVLAPEATNLASEVTADMAMRSRPGPPAGCFGAGAGPTGAAPLTTVDQP